MNIEVPSLQKMIKEYEANCTEGPEFLKYMNEFRTRTALKMKQDAPQGFSCISYNHMFLEDYDKGKISIPANIAKKCLKLMREELIRKGYAIEEAEGQSEVLFFVHWDKEFNSN